MSAPPLARSGRIAATLALVTLGIAACARQSSGAPAPPGRVSDGVALSLSLPKTSFKVGEPMPAHVEATNLAARRPVAASFCSHFGLSYRNLATGEAGYVQAQPAACGGDPLHDNLLPLRPGRPLVVDVPNAQLELKPGVYAVMASWDASTVGQETALRGPRYGAIASNVVTVKVLPL
jgi:hypothetical protein